MKRLALLSLCFVILLSFFVGCDVGTSEEKIKPPAKVVPEEYEYPRFKVVDTDGNTIVTEAHLISVEICGYDAFTSSYVLMLAFDEEGAELFAQATSENIGKSLSFYCDGVLLSEPVVNEAITDGEVLITGISTAEEMQNLFETISAVMHGEEK